MIKRSLLLVFTMANTAFADGLESHSHSHGGLQSDLSLINLNVAFPQTAKCQSSMFTNRLDLKISKFAEMGKDIGARGSCLEIKTNPADRFSELNCQSIIDCSNSKTVNDNPTIFNSIPVLKYIAEDYVALRMGRDINKMEKMNELKKYAEKKYGKDITSHCSSPFDFSAEDESMKKSCDPFIVDSGFNRMQEHCSLMSSACYSKLATAPDIDYQSFHSQAKKDGSISIVQSFFEMRSEKKLGEFLKNDSESLDAIVGILSAEKNSSQLQKVFLKMLELKNQGLLDPVLAYEKEGMDNTKVAYKKSYHFKFFENLLAQKLSKEDMKNAIEKYKIKTADALLSNSCKDTAKFSDICQNATELYKSNRIATVTREKAASLLAEDHEDERFENLKKIYPMGIYSLDDFKIVMDAQRCKAFNFVDAKVTAAISGEVVGETSLGVSNANWYSKPPSANNLIKAEGAGFSSSASRIIPIASSSSSGEVIKKADSPETNDISPSNYKPQSSLASDLPKTTANLPLTNPTHTVLDNPVEQKPATPVSAESKSPPRATASHNEQIKALEEKLSASEKKLSSIQENYNTELARQQKANEENKKISELQKQIDDLKARPKTSEDDSKNTAAINPAAAIITSKTAPVSEEISNESRASLALPENRGREISSNQALAPENSSSNAMGRTPASLNNGGSALAGSSKSGIVLTKTEGMTPEKFTETITAKILEMEGQPFLIEEGGMIKEIIPEVKDGKIILDKEGKPVFAKLVKGDVKSKKFAKMKIIGREPASIVTNADLARDQEEQLKRKRDAYYKALREITSKASKKN